jgi:hypothetical protein
MEDRARHHEELAGQWRALAAWLAERAGSNVYN